MRCWWGVRTCGSCGSWAQSNSGRTLWRRHKTRRSHGRHRRGWSHCQSWSGHSPTNWLRYRHSWRYHGSLNRSILWAVVPRKKIGCNDRRLLRIVCWEILQRTEWDRWDRWSVSHLRPLSFHHLHFGLTPLLISDHMWHMAISNRFTISPRQYDGLVRGSWSNRSIRIHVCITCVCWVIFPGKTGQLWFAQMIQGTDIFNNSTDGFTELTDAGLGHLCLWG